MPQSPKRTALRNLCHTQQEVVQQAVNAFNDPNVSDADVLTALQSAGNSCRSATYSIPAFVGSYGQWVAHYVWQALSDGGLSLVQATIVAPGAFQFSGIETSVGPYTLRDRLEGLVTALNTYASQIDAEEAGSGSTGGTPSSPSAGTTNRISITLVPI
jgi:hypothetical protein